MEKILWLPDAHLELLNPWKLRDFLRALTAEAPDLLLLGGDTATASYLDLPADEPSTGLRYILQRLAQVAPLALVLGNHDYYVESGGTRPAIDEVRRQIRADAAASGCRQLFLESLPFLPLALDLALVGHGLWGDGRAGLGSQTDMVMKDFEYITDFRDMSREQIFTRLAELGREGAEHLRQGIVAAIGAGYRRIWVLTHAPIAMEVCLKPPRPAHDLSAFFCCVAAGETLHQLAQAHPGVEFTVLSGHTHSGAQAQLRPNLLTRVLGATYGQPQWEQLSTTRSFR